MRSVQTKQFSRFLPSTYVGHIKLAAAKHWRACQSSEMAAVLNLFLSKSVGVFLCSRVNDTMFKCLEPASVKCLVTDLHASGVAMSIYRLLSSHYMIGGLQVSSIKSGGISFISIRYQNKKEHVT